MIVHIHKLIDNKYYNCCLKTNSIMLFCYFVVYGFYGAVLPRLSGDYYSLKIAAITLILLIPPLILILNYNSEYAYKFCFKIIISKYQIIFVVLASCIGIHLGYERLNISLYSDELAYASSANGHGIVLINYLSKHSSLNSINVSLALRLINIFILIFLIITYIYIRKLNKKIIGILFISFFLLFRLLYAIRGGNGNPHPPLELLPILVTGTILGINELGLKLSSYLITVAFLYILYRQIRRQSSVCNAILVIACISSIPILNELSYLIEHSIWGMFFFSIVLFEINTCINLNYLRLFIFISIGCLLRHSVVIAFIPLVLNYLFRDFRFTKIPDILKYQCYKIWLLPILIFLPMLIYGLIMGTPAIKGWAYISSLLKFDYIRKINIIEVRNYFELFPAILIIPFIFTFVRINESRSIIVINVIYFIFLLKAYFSINSGLIFLTKYQSEIFVPFIALGIYKIIKLFSLNRLNILSFLFCIAVVASNLYIISLIRSDDSNLKNKLTVNYNYRDAYDKIRMLGFQSNVYSIGITYGNFTELINNYSINEFINVKSIYEKLKNAENLFSRDSFEYINAIIKNDAIHAVILQNTSDGYFIHRNLLEAGWVDKSDMLVSSGQGKLFILVRPLRQ